MGEAGRSLVAHFKGFAIVLGCANTLKASGCSTWLLRAPKTV
jgi:hypothetical protein